MLPSIIFSIFLKISFFYANPSLEKNCHQRDGNWYCRTGIFYLSIVKAKKTTSSFINPAFSEYISSYTAGVISSGSSIRIVLANDAVDSSFIGQEASVNLFSFQPSLKGKNIWLDQRTIEFKPDVRMEAGQIYEASFQLSKLITVTNELSEFQFSFQVMPQNFEVAIDNVKPYVKTELTRQRVEGTFSTADFAEDAAVEGMIARKSGGKEFKGDVEPYGGRQATFVCCRGCDSQRNLKPA